MANDKKNRNKNEDKVSDCIFRCKVATDSGAKLPPKPF